MRRNAHGPGHPELGPHWAGFRLCFIPMGWRPNFLTQLLMGWSLNYVSLLAQPSLTYFAQRRIHTLQLRWA